MSYSKYGQVFRAIRHKNGLPLSALSKIGIDGSNIARFERGESMLAIDKLAVCLQEMNVSLAEYELLINHFIPDYETEFFFDLENYDFSRNIKGLESLYLEAESEGKCRFALAAKACFVTLSKKDCDFLLAYFENLDYWTFPDLKLAYFCIFHFKSGDISRLIKASQGRNYSLGYHFCHLRSHVQLISRAMILFASRGKQKKAQQMADRLHKFEIKRDFFAINLIAIAEAVYCLQFEDKKKGMEELEKCLDKFSSCDAGELASYYRFHFQLMGILP
ncbi:helix-turn-helix domain-containing protein [Lactococcus termiticola]|uniref:XRE family transcriptional regulator n=1 Tax=Lactococcus termiticola TaxID=2169526 RepID=A0A2R5HK51_9LACT|nr:Rgg/GadR/MutR family transcriptional regulator [Lactococcus termiticola]GBG96841.1 XRE family transcriptional regulator [Lactococcus termiticola]